MSVRKLLAFDSWTEGSHHLEVLLPALAARDISIVLVHLGSWGNDAGRPKEERKNGLLVRDIAWYGGNSLERVLDAERPDAVVLLSTATFAHRAFLRYCKARGIPSLHLYHSLMSVQVTDDHAGSVKANPLAYARLVLSMVTKLITRTFPCYIGALLKTNAEWEDWHRFFVDTLKLAVGRPIWQPDVARDARTTKCAVYVGADREHAHRVYGVPMQDIVAVGNPDLVRFGITDSLLGSHLTAAPSRRIMYIDTGLAMFGLAFASVGAFVQHLRFTAQQLGKQGFTLCFKPHPVHKWELLQDLLDGSGIEMIPNDRFVPALSTCAACIVEMSSVTLVPALMGLPLLYANYNELSNLRFGPVLQTYPRGHILRDLADVNSILELDRARLDECRLREWISENAGPLPAELHPERVANVIANMMDDFPRSRQVGNDVTAPKSCSPVEDVCDA